MKDARLRSACDKKTHRQTAMGGRGSVIWRLSRDAQEASVGSAGRRQDVLHFFQRRLTKKVYPFPHQHVQNNRAQIGVRRGAANLLLDLFDQVLGIHFTSRFYL